MPRSRYCKALETNADVAKNAYIKGRVGRVGRSDLVRIIVRFLRLLPSVVSGVHLCRLKAPICNQLSDSLFILGVDDSKL